jgi:hypothetical protein
MPDYYASNNNTRETMERPTTRPRRIMFSFFPYDVGSMRQSAFLRVVIMAAFLLGNLSSASSQQDDGVCRAPKPSVGSVPREYIVGGNTFHIPIMDYLTDVVGSQFDPPISFTRRTANLYMKTSTVEESLAMGYDFMVNHPYATSCYESEGQAVSLATQFFVKGAVDTGEIYNLTQYGAVLYVLQNRTDIQTMADIKGKKVGTNKITNLATYVALSRFFFSMELN